MKDKEFENDGMAQGQLFIPFPVMHPEYSFKKFAEYSANIKNVEQLRTAVEIALALSSKESK